MCGIVAIFSSAGDVERETLERAMRSLRHRGPDAEGSWLDASRRVGLGHTRLSIIDPGGGQQPISNEDESIHCVVNGEIYDFERVRRELEGKGHRFRSGSDSETLVHLYEEYGISCVEHLRGEVAFVLYDARTDLLIAGRDRFGIKPLFYAHDGGALVLASEAKALFAAGIAARWDAESFVQSSLLVGTTLEDRTHFAGVHQVPPAHVLVATRGGARLVRYWDFDYPREDEPRIHARTEREDREALLAAVDEAIRLRLRADVPVACYLSGGIDSGTVLGLAARHQRGKLRAFTIGFDRAEYDELPMARAMAEHAGAEFTAIPMTQGDLAVDLAQAIFHSERPLFNANAVAKFRLSRAVRDAGIKVVLTGEGADEIFAGYPHYRRDLLLREARDAGAGSARGLSELQRSNTISHGTMLPDGAGVSLAAARAALGGFVPSWLEAAATAANKFHAFLSPEFRTRAVAHDAVARFIGSLEISRQLRGRHFVHQSMYLWSHSILPNLVLNVIGDRMEMAHSVEGRLPFLDHHVVELVRGMNVDRLIFGTVEKYILREIAKPFVPDVVYRRQKHPFYAPPISSPRSGTLHEMLQDTLRSPRLLQVPFFDPPRILEVLDGLPRLDDAALTALDAPLMVVLSTVLLQLQFGMSAPRV